MQLEEQNESNKNKDNTEEIKLTLKQIFSDLFQKIGKTLNTQDLSNHK